MDASSTQELRAKLVDGLRQRGFIETDRVAGAFLRVPREAFVPLVRAEELYRDVVIATHRNRRGESISSSSQPLIMARMLEMLCVEPDQNILEVGAGTGYNAALLRELVGPKGRVTTIDIQPDVASEAAQHLQEAGYDDVTVLAADGFLGFAGHAPYDRLVVTASCSDIPAAWWSQLQESGILVLPLHPSSGRGSQLPRQPVEFVVVSLRRTAAGFRSERAVGGGFMAMQRVLASGSRMRFIGPRKDLGLSPPYLSRSLDPDVLLRLFVTQPDEATPPILKAILSAPAPQFIEYWAFNCFLAVSGERPLQITTRNDIYGFRFALALVDTRIPSAALLVFGPPLSPPGRRPPATRLLTFGGDAMRRRFVELAEKYESIGRPKLEQLQLEMKAVENLSKGRSKSPWQYRFWYADPAPASAGETP